MKRFIFMFAGLHPPQAGPCEALSSRGFFGIEPKVVEAIAGWIFERIPEGRRPQALRV